MARTQMLVQLSDELLGRLDARRAREGRSRSDVIREAIELYLAADREAEIDRPIVEAYAPPAARGRLGRGGGEADDRRGAVVRSRG